MAAISQREMPVSGSEHRARSSDCSADQNYKEVICDSDAAPACDEASNILRSSYVKLGTSCGEEGNSFQLPAVLFIRYLTAVYLI